MKRSYDQLSPLQRQTCPLCGQSNECEPSKCVPGAVGGECWCTRATIDPAVLARVPEADRDVVCICRRCAGSAPGANGVEPAHDPL